MKRLFLIMIILGISSIPSATPNAQASGCGFKPLKPLPPLGCKDLYAVCRCDQYGQNCYWEWVCIPY